MDSISLKLKFFLKNQGSTVLRDQPFELSPPHMWKETAGPQNHPLPTRAPSPSPGRGQAGMEDPASPRPVLGGEDSGEEVRERNLLDHCVCRMLHSVCFSLRLKKLQGECSLSLRKVLTLGLRYSLGRPEFIKDHAEAFE